jgi:hypothetical protein
MTTAGIRIGSLSVDGTPISETDLARIKAEEKLHDRLQQQAVRVIAGSARDAADCRIMLDMLGIGDDVVSAARAEGKIRPAAKTGRKRRVAAA